MAELLLIGLLGAFIQLAAFALNLFGKLSHDSARYAGANAFGCVLTASYAIMNNDIPFLVLEVAWGTFAAYKLLK